MQKSNTDDDDGDVGDDNVGDETAASEHHHHSALASFLMSSSSPEWDQNASVSGSTTSCHPTQVFRLKLQTHGADHGAKIEHCIVILCNFPLGSVTYILVVNRKGPLQVPALCNKPKAPDLATCYITWLLPKETYYCDLFP